MKLLAVSGCSWQILACRICVMSTPVSFQTTEILSKHACSDRIRIGFQYLVQHQIGMQYCAVLYLITLQHIHNRLSVTSRSCQIDLEGEELAMQSSQTLFSDLVDRSKEALSLFNVKVHLQKLIKYIDIKNNLLLFVLFLPASTDSRLECRTEIEFEHTFVELLVQLIKFLLKRVLSLLFNMWVNGAIQMLDGMIFQIDGAE